MSITVGVAITDHLALGIVENHQLILSANHKPEDERTTDSWRGVPADVLLDTVASQVAALADHKSVDSVGLALPGLVRNGAILESTILPQLQGGNLADMLRAALRNYAIEPAHVAILNDADAIAAGIAAQRIASDKKIRVWLLGDGVGFGCYPSDAGLWEGGHVVVSLDPHEKYCGCGGRGHLEGIVGARAMRLRFFDLEPEEVFSSAFNGDDPRCSEFLILWHRAIAAATASSIHLNGPAVYCLAGPFAAYVNLGLLHRYTEEMVTLTSLKGYSFEVIRDTEQAALIGAADCAAKTH